jgi:hypothetical protein
MNTINASPQTSTQSNIMTSEPVVKRKTRNLQALETSSSAFVKEQPKESSNFYEKRETDRLNHDLHNPYKDVEKEVEKEVEPIDLTNLELFPTLGNNTDQNTKNISIWNITNHNILAPSTQKTILKKNDEKKVERVQKKSKKSKKYDSDEESLSDKSEEPDEYDENEEENLDIEHINNLMKKRDFLEMILEISEGKLTKSNIDQMQFYNNIKNEYYKLDEEVQYLKKIDDDIEIYYGNSNNSLLEEHVQKNKMSEELENLEKRTEEFLSMLEDVDL